MRQPADDAPATQHAGARASVETGSRGNRRGTSVKELGAPREGEALVDSPRADPPAAEEAPATDKADQDAGIALSGDDPLTVQARTPAAIAGELNENPAECCAIPNRSIEVSLMQQVLGWPMWFFIGLGGGLVLSLLLVWCGGAIRNRARAARVDVGPLLLGHDQPRESAPDTPRRQKKVAGDVDERRRGSHVVEQASAVLEDESGSPMTAIEPHGDIHSVDPSATVIRHDFNARALPGIAYVGRAFEPKLAFPTMEEGAVALVVAYPITSFQQVRVPLRDFQRSGASVERVGASSASAYPQDAKADRHAHPMEFTDSDHARQVEALEAQLALRPGDLSLKIRLGSCLLKYALVTGNEMVRASLLDASIDYLHDVSTSDQAGVEPLALLGDACYRRSLIGPEIDVIQLANAETALRRAMAAGASACSDVAWSLQQVLCTVTPGSDRRAICLRLQEALELLDRGIEAGPSDLARWGGAVLLAQLKLTKYGYRNATARRLRLRELHAKYVDDMHKENSPLVLSAWVELLCAIAEPLTGDAAAERYQESEIALMRLAAIDQGGKIYALAFSSFVLGRTHAAHGKARHDLLVQAEAILVPYVEHDEKLRLQAAFVAIAQARIVPPDQAAVHYRQAIARATPLAAVPSLALEALRVMLVALLALDETNDRRVYARCLEVMTASDDVDSLFLLAESAFRDARHAAGCLYCEKAWRAGGAIPAVLLSQWQRAHASWLESDGSSGECLGNQRYLRMARACRGHSPSASVSADGTFGPSRTMHGAAA